MKYPKPVPKIIVDIVMGIMAEESFHHTIKDTGINVIMAIINPFKGPFKFRFVVDIKKPTTIQCENAERFESHSIF